MHRIGQKKEETWRKDKKKGKAEKTLHFPYTKCPSCGGKAVAETVTKEIGGKFHKMGLITCQVCEVQTIEGIK